MADEQLEQPASRGRMTLYYAVLALITAAVAAVVISAGHDEKARPSIAGGYDARGPVPCLGPSFDVKQSGEFVNFTNNQSTLSGRLRLKGGGKLTGDVDCVNGKSAHFTGIASAGSACWRTCIAIRRIPARRSRVRRATSRAPTSSHRARPASAARSS